MIRVIYASRLMKGWEVRLACKKFREQEAAIRKARFKAGERRGYRQRNGLIVWHTIKPW